MLSHAQFMLHMDQQLQVDAGNWRGGWLMLTLTFRRLPLMGTS